MTSAMTEIAVVKATKAGAVVSHNGKCKTIDWPTLKAASRQDDAMLRDTYAAVLSEALRMASLEKHLTVRVNNRTNTTHGYTAELYDVAGEFVSRRIVAADWGLDGTGWYAERDCDRAIAALSPLGYTVTRE